MYKDQLRALLSPDEHAVFKKLNTPNKIQDYLDALPQNFSYNRGLTFRSPRRLLQKPMAYCFEGAVFAAASLAYHGREPLLMDLRTTKDDEDHVVALFKENGLWGAISKTNYTVVKWRDPIYRDVRELAMSYFNEFFLHSGEKTFKDYSLPFNMKKFSPEKWVTATDRLEWLALALDRSPHVRTVPQGALKRMRFVTPSEIKTLDIREWEGKERLG